jgi:hypothetical protein
MWRMVWEVVDLPVAEAATKIDSLFRDLGSPLYDYALLELRKVTRIHLIGGGHITSHWPAHIQLLRGALTLGELSGAPVTTTGLGLTPSPDADFVREMIGKFDYATVRDEPSAELAGVPVEPDDSFLGLDQLPGFDPRPTAAPAEGDRGEIWVDLQRDLADEETFERQLGLIRDFLTSDVAEGRAIRYVEAIPGGDRVAYERLSDLIPEKDFFPFVRLWAEPFPARPRQIWLTSRFHLHVIAAACGAAGVAFEIDDHYYRGKHGSVVELTGWSLATKDSTEPIMPSGGNAFRMTAQRLHRVKVLEAEKLFPRTR